LTPSHVVPRIRPHACEQRSDPFRLDGRIRPRDGRRFGGIGSATCVALFAPPAPRRGARDRRNDAGRNDFRAEAEAAARWDWPAMCDARPTCAVSFDEAEAQLDPSTLLVTRPSPRHDRPDEKMSLDDWEFNLGSTSRATPLRPQPPAA